MIRININMRCIEIMQDMLPAIPPDQININMRCIEIVDNTYISDEELEININMRCIEIEIDEDLGGWHKGLTLT